MHDRSILLPRWRRWRGRRGEEAPPASVVPGDSQGWWLKSFSPALSLFFELQSHTSSSLKNTPTSSQIRNVQNLIFPARKEAPATGSHLFVSRAEGKHTRLPLSLWALLALSPVTSPLLPRTTSAIQLPSWLTCTETRSFQLAGSLSSIPTQFQSNSKVIFLGASPIPLSS